VVAQVPIQAAAKTAQVGAKGAQAAGKAGKAGVKAGKAVADGAKKTAQAGKNTAQAGKRTADAGRRTANAGRRTAANAGRHTNNTARNAQRINNNRPRNRNNQYSRIRPDIRKRLRNKRREALGQRDPEELDQGEKALRFAGRRIKRLARLDHDQKLRRRLRRTLILLAAILALFFLPTLTLANATEEEDNPEDLLALEPAPPVAGGYGLCPIAGKTTYSNDWGAPRQGGRTHQGLDLFAESGTPVIAVEDGQVEHGTDGLGGNVYRLTADDGTYYYGAHLSAYENVGIGRVTAGTVIGYVGNSGDARDTPSHLHWQIHPGGRGSAPSPPYETANGLCGLNGELSGTSGGTAGPVGSSRSANTARGTIQVVDVPAPGGGTITVNVSIGTQVKALLDAAAADGLKLSGSGFRTLDQQIALRKKNGCPDVWTSPSSSCRVPTATPGKSMHEQGTAIDFTNCGSFSTRCFEWLDVHAKTYGLKNLGCVTATKCEPWHWSPNGK
jgi:murein DD-endopeptidase MepM/ murein hydrolase activator NlpD